MGSFFCTYYLTLLFPWMLTNELVQLFVGNVTLILKNFCRLARSLYWSNFRGKSFWWKKTSLMVWFLIKDMKLEQVVQHIWRHCSLRTPSPLFQQFYAAHNTLNPVNSSLPSSSNYTFHDFYVATICVSLQFKVTKWFNYCNMMILSLFSTSIYLTLFNRVSVFIYLFYRKYLNEHLMD